MLHHNMPNFNDSIRCIFWCRSIKP